LKEEALKCSLYSFQQVLLGAKTQKNNINRGSIGATIKLLSLSLSTSRKREIPKVKKMNKKKKEWLLSKMKWESR
jgi:hypothetical protein